MRIARSLIFGALALAVSGPALAQWGPWGYGGYGYGRAGWDRPGGRGPARSERDDREGKVEVTRFLSQGADAAAFGHGQIAVQVTANAVKTDTPKGAFAPELPRGKPASGYGPADLSHDDRAADNPHNDATYEAAVIDQLVKLGYDTTAPGPTGGQVVELTINRGVLEPPEPPHKPVSGEMDVGVSNRGSAVGGAIYLDFTKPAKALLSTRLEARIRDRATGKALWEGRADIATRDGDSNWTEQKIATRLADALFGGFPGKSGETVILR